MRRWVILVLVSGVGLIAFALVSLWGSVRDITEQQQKTARQLAEDRAEKVRAMLRQLPLEPDRTAWPKHSFFAYRDKKREYPTLLHRMPDFQESALPAEARELLAIARQQEFAQKDQVAAAKTFDRALQTKGLEPWGRGYLISAAAWQAYRAGKQKMSASLLEKVGNVAHPNVAASVLLLSMDSHGGSLPLAGNQRLEGLLGVLANMQQDHLQPLLEVLTQSDQHPDAKQMRSTILEFQRTLEVSEVLVKAAPQLWQGETLVAVGKHVVLYHWKTHGKGTGTGTGKVLPMDDPMLRKACEEVDADVVFRSETEPLPADSVPVVPGLIGVRVKDTAPTLWTEPVVLFVLLGLLALCFAGGLVLSFRAMHKENDAVRSRADFLTSVTHELKTPLSSIRLFAEMLEEGRVRSEDKKQQYYRLLAGESARLTVLIENVLDLGRMERGERAYDLRSQPIDNRVEEAVTLFRPLAERDGMRLQTDLQGGDVAGAIDSGALVQALLNVMENARKYACQGGALEIDSTVTHQHYELTVRDHGPGIPPAEHESIFERFARGASHRDGSVAGVGLGLYLARTILRAHGGDLRCETPTEGPGTLFRFTLPLPAGRTRSDHETGAA